MADSIYRKPISDYTCPQQAARGREVFFRRGPVNLGLGCLLPNPGDRMTHDYTGVKILLARQPDGSLSASLNVCLFRRPGRYYIGIQERGVRCGRNDL
jgi:hypothetical protein